MPKQEIKVTGRLSMYSEQASFKVYVVGDPTERK